MRARPVPHTMPCRRLTILLLSLLLLPAAPPLSGQMPEHTAGKDEFPALQLLPLGSKILGLSLPRYQGHRVVAHIMAKVIEVSSRHVVSMDDVRTILYGEEGDTTEVRLKHAEYDFRTNTMTSQSALSATNPRYSVSGTGAVFNTDTRCGLLRGPVYTTLNLNVISKPPTPPHK